MIIGVSDCRRGFPGPVSFESRRSDPLETGFSSNNNARTCSECLLEHRALELFRKVNEGQAW